MTATGALRVAYLSSAPFISGAERSLQTTLEAAQDAGIDPLLVCPPESPMSTWAASANVPYITATLAERDRRKPLRWWRSVSSLRRILRAHRIDVMHSNQIWSFPAAAAAARSLGISRVCHMRDEITPETVRWWCAPGVEGVVCISEHMRRRVTGLFAESVRPPVIVTLINPVRPAVMTSPEDEARRRERARGTWTLASGDIVLGFVGQLIPVKGLLELLEAVAQVPAEPHWTLLVAGRSTQGGEYESRCRERARQLGLLERVKFVGFMERLDDFYRAIDIAVVPSLEEPLGRIPLEAAAFGRPSIAFSTGGLPETIDSGRTGWLVPAGDVGALAKTIGDGLRESLEPFGRAARQFVSDTCDPRQYVRNLASFYRSLLGQP